MTAITLDEAKERIRRLAEKRPDFVYEPVKVHEEDEAGTCRYFDRDGNPSCIIGHAFADELRALGLGSGVEGRGARSVLGELGAEYAAQSFANDVQIAQDSGVPWGDAYRDALGLLAEE